LFSTSPVLIIWAAPLSSYEVTFGRLGVAGLSIGVVALLTGQPVLPRRADLWRFALFGLITALHFWFYVASLSYTTIAHSLAIVYTAPVFVTLFSAMFLHEPLPMRKLLGVAVTVVGIAILAGFEPRMNRSMLIGDLLALGSAISFGLYSVAGRSQRQRYGLFTYAGTVYSIAALWLAPVALLNFTPAGYQLHQLLAVFAAGLIPLGIGHTLYNAALRRTHATTVNLIATQEVTGGVLLGALMLAQLPQVNELLGIVVALLGIVLVVF
jgi:drug/metabolite transporter (DMT)-like permease